MASHVVRPSGGGDLYDGALTAECKQLTGRTCARGARALGSWGR